MSASCRSDVWLERLLMVTAVALFGALVMPSLRASQGGYAVSAAPTASLAAQVERIGDRVDEVSGKQERQDATQIAILERLKNIEGLDLSGRLKLIEAHQKEQSETWKDIRGLAYTVVGGLLVLVLANLLNLKESVKHRRRYDAIAGASHREG